MPRWAALAAAVLMTAATAPAMAQTRGEAMVADRCRGAAGGGLPASWSNRRKVVHLAVCEWSKFGYQTVEIRPVPLAEAQSLPGSLGLTAALGRGALPPPPGYEHVTPAIAAQVRFGPTESDRSASPLVENYWSAVRPSLVTAVRRAREAADQGGGGRSLYPGWWDPWSAAFVSWTFQTAGVSWFRGSASHVLYLQAAMVRRPGSVVGISRYRPLPGDLICAPRADGAGEPTAVSEAGFLKALEASGEHFDSHCDVVVRVNAASVVSIGGNVENAVTATVTPLRRGRLMRTAVRPWSAALTMGEPYDPCARIEAVDLKGWGKMGDARKAALRRTGCSRP
jgi:hypothetical protein